MTASTTPNRTAATESNFLNDLARLAAASNQSDWETVRGIYADWLGDNDRHDEAQSVRDRVRYVDAKHASRWPDVVEMLQGSGASAHQCEQLAKALTCKIGVLVGSPGTGKTFLLARLVACLARMFGGYSVAVCAPTGKAAVRCRQMIEQYEHEHPHEYLGVATPSTVHRLLKIGRNGHDGQGWGFRCNRDKPLPYRFVIADEWSMADVSLARSLLEACRGDTHVLLVGDTGQLSPVGHGTPLRDMIDARVPCGELTEIHRNAGMIVEACAAIRRGESFELASGYKREAGRNLLHVPTRKPADTLDVLTNLLARMGESGSFDPFVDVQVLCAVNERSELGRAGLNKLLQPLLNRQWIAARGNLPRCGVFYPGDKIICLQNGEYQIAPAEAEGDEQADRGIEVVRDGPALILQTGTGLQDYWDDGRDYEEDDDDFADSVASDSGGGNRRNDTQYVANGEMGIVTSVTRNGSSLVAQFGDGTDVLLSLVDLEDFDLGYAVTVHKYQGSQSRVVIVPIDESYGAANVCSKEWCYTAISRASDLCIVIGKAERLRWYATREALEKRRTFLRDLILDGVGVGAGAGVSVSVGIGASAGPNS